MKKKISFLIFSCLLVLLLASCDEVLSVVTVDENGDKVVNNYVSILDNTIYEESASLKSWQDLEIFSDDSVLDIDNLLFKIENKKDSRLVLGDKTTAVELEFFEGGYDVELFASLDSLNNAMDAMDFSDTDY